VRFKNTKDTGAISSADAGKGLDQVDRINIRIKSLELANAKKIEAEQVLELAGKYEFFILTGKRLSNSDKS